MSGPWVEEPPADGESFARFAALARRQNCVWLDTATGEGKSILASDPFQIIRAKGSQIQVVNSAGTRTLFGNPFAVLETELARQSGNGAAIGYFGYDLKNFIEKLPARAGDDIGLPDLWFGFYSKLRVGAAARGSPPLPVNPQDRHGGRPRQSNFTPATYRAAVLRAKEYIAAGDIYQVNLSQRFQCEVSAPAPEVYLALRAANPAPYCVYLDIGDAQILSSSPECFLKIDGRQVITRPIKGTRPRATDPAELLASPKDNAELLMITDLERNDLGRVCEYGSVHVPELVRVESYATVHHLVATVAGTLRSAVSHVGCVRACFPGGSITGAPKIRAMQIIDELEPHARGIYTGAIGYFGFDGHSDFNIAIRTVVQQGRRLTFHAGGGIVADSEADAEYAETLAKAQGIFNALDQLRLRQR
ncbi:MAG: Aminodeoxychorismate synthase component 1 [Verrucomicrobiae bacterium]|nr:Aminodeoxychorismate synthase component 1 [Verrucomicrobiae bacterium]